jgi:hypothetical protein
LLLWTVRSFSEGAIRQNIAAMLSRIQTSAQFTIQHRHHKMYFAHAMKPSVDFLYFIPVMVTDNIADNILITLFVLQECLCINTTWSLHNGAMSIIAFSLFMMFQLHSPIF